MTTILAPTRGGESSYPTQELAIRLAAEQNAELIFMYVSDVRFLDTISVSIIRDLEQDLAGLGEFILTMAQEQAEKQGVQADQVVRRGNFGQALRGIIRERRVDVVILGVPQEETGITNRDYLHKLATSLADELGVTVHLVSDGTIATTHSPGQPAAG